MLGKFDLDLKERATLGSSERQVTVFRLRGWATWGSSKVCVGKVLVELLSGAERPVQKFVHWPVGPEFRLAISFDIAAGDDHAAPVLHDAQAVNEDRVRRVRERDGRRLVDEVVAKVPDDLQHALERLTDEPHTIVDSHQPSSSVSAPLA